MWYFCSLIALRLNSNLQFGAHMMLSGPQFSSDLVEAMTKFVGPGIFLLAKVVKAVWSGKLLAPEMLFTAWFLSLVHVPMVCILSCNLLYNLVY